MPDEDSTPLCRLATATDANACALIYASAVHPGFASFEESAPDAIEIQRRMSLHAATHPWLVAELNGAVAGYTVATPHRTRAAYRWSVDVSTYVDESARGRGVGGTLLALSLDVLRAHGFLTAFAGVALPNPASVALHESAGFIAIGIERAVGFKAGAWRDVGWWQCSLADRPAHDPPVPRALDSDLIATVLARGV